MHDERFDDEPQDGDEPSFAELLAQSLPDKRPALTPGTKVTATLLQVGSEWSFLDVGQKGEGVIASAELLDNNGEALYKKGDQLSAYFLSRSGGELRFTTRIGGSGAGTEQIEEAYRAGIPVDGRIEKEIKGGFEVKLPGNVRGFCPFSQSGQRQGEASALIGQSLSFKITQFGEGGRNIVLSHRAILEEQREQQRSGLRATLKEGMRVQGTVTNIRDFGAFVDIGGIEGLLPVSEISYGRVEDIQQILHSGQQLELVIKKLDWDNNKFSFSLRDTLADPWQTVSRRFPVGSRHSGKVCRLAQFGAFVTLEEGIDGLLHISKLGETGQRLRHAQDLLKVGQKLEVVIEKIETAERRISLALAKEADEVVETSYRDTPAGPSAGFGSMADLFKAGQQKNNRGKPRR